MTLRVLTFTCILSLALAPQAAPATFTVNSADDTADSQPGDGICATPGGACTFRAAIQEANALGGSHIIDFSIGSGAQTIIPTSPLPSVTAAVVIDATTQPGYSGAPLIELNGTSLRSNTNGLNVTGGSSTIRGLLVNRFPGSGLRLAGAGGHLVQACWIGIDLTGAVAQANDKNGILVDNSPNNLIGGTTADARNVVSGNLGLGGIVVSGAAAGGNVVQGNFVGTNAAGNAAIPNNGRGIAVQNAPNNLIGGTVPGARNIISGNRASGVRVLGGSATGNVVQGNYVGLDVTGKAYVPNSRGLQSRSNNTLFGGPTPEAANLIAGNTIDGVALISGSNDNLVQGNTILGNHTGIAAYSDSSAGNVFSANSVYGNKALGIDLIMGGVTPNDPGDLDSHVQNFPVLASATTTGTSVTISGSLNSTVSNSFTLEFFTNKTCDPSGNGEGQRFLGQAVISTDASGNATFQSTLPVRVAPGQFVTATATQATDGTSEFSACIVLTL